MAKISEIEGVGPAMAEKMVAAGVSTVEALLKTGATKKGREALAESTGISYAVLLKWVNYADLFRIKGVGSEFSELLEAAGVDTVPELGQRNAANLQKKMEEVNAEKKLTRRVPTEKQVTDWVSQAKQLPKVVTH